MGATLTRSVWSLRAIVQNYLAAKMPLFVNQARTDWSLTAKQLPYPAKYDAIEPQQSTGSEYPILGAHFPSDDNWVRTDYTDVMEEEYWATYNALVFCWVRTPEHETVVGAWEEPQYDSAVRLRDDMLELIHQALLWKQDLDAPNDCWVEETSFRRNRLDAIKVNTQGDRWFAGGTISFNIRYRMELSRVKLGDANTIVVDERRVAVGSPMP